MTLTPETIAELRAELMQVHNRVIASYLDTSNAPAETVHSLAAKALDAIERYRKALEEIRNAATSFCDCDGDFVASQVTIRVDAALGDEHDR